jgi:protein O-mannosyl-transferase
MRGSVISHERRFFSELNLSKPIGFPLIASALFLTVWVSYAPALQAGFIWDDTAHVHAVGPLQSLEGLWKIWTMPGTVQQYYPLTYTLFWVMFQLFGATPAPYHLLNIFIHALNAILLLYLLQRLGVPLAIWAAFIFAVHPIQVESVAWISELKNVLSLFFCLLSLIAFFRHIDRRSDRAWYVASLITYGVALASKTISCVIPVVILLIAWGKGRKLRPLLPFLAPYFLLGLLAGLMTLYVETRWAGATGQEWDLSILQHILLAGHILWFYIGKLLWPLPLAFIYPRWEINPSDFSQGVAPLIVLVGVAWLWARRTSWRGTLTALLLYAALLFPALGFFNLYPMRYSFVADHFQYMAGIPIIVWIVNAGAVLGRRFKISPFAGGVLGIILVGVLAIGTHARARVFQTAEGLWRDTLRTNPDSGMVHTNLGMELLRQNRLEETAVHLQRALEINPISSESHANLGVLYERQGRWEEAIAAYQKGLEFEPERESVRSRLGIAYLRKGRYRDAMIELEKVRDQGEANYFQTSEPRKTWLRQQLAQAKGNLGLAYFMQTRFKEAEKEWTEALSLTPNDPVLHYHVGEMWLKRGDPKRSQQAFETALRFDPHFSEAIAGLQKVKK